MPGTDAKLPPGPSEFLAMAASFGDPPNDRGGCALALLAAVRDCLGDRGKTYLQLLRGTREAKLDDRWEGVRRSGVGALHRRAPSVTEMIKSGVLQDLPADSDRLSIVGHRRSYTNSENYDQARWMLGYSPAEPTHLSTPEGGVYPVRDPTLCVSINIDQLRSEESPDDIELTSLEEFAQRIRDRRYGNAAALRLPSMVAEIFDRAACFYAVFDVGIDAEIRAGTYYQGLPMGEVSWAREVNHRLWLLAGERRRRHVRGVYWGQYLGPDLARRFDPEGAFGDRFRRTPFLAEGWSGPIYRRFDSGGLFVTLTADPLDLSYDSTRRTIPERHASDWTGEMLHRQFRDTGLLL